MDDSIARAITKLKNEFVRAHTGQNLLREFLPLSYSKALPIDHDILQLLRAFAAANPIYIKSYESEISGIACMVYEGDINRYWLSSKKYDTSYQLFYPTWLLSAFVLVNAAKSLGFEQLVDVGSGDGRIAYCGKLLGIESYGIEIDHDLVQLQNLVSAATGVSYTAIRADATRFDYGTLNLSRPIFFISGLPEMGEMLANSILGQIKAMTALRQSAGFNFMGSHLMRPQTRDQTGWGWGNIVANHNLELIGTLTLPTLWTTDQIVDTAYVYTRFRAELGPKI
jgi:hypothetical protein